MPEYTCYRTVNTTEVERAWVDADSVADALDLIAAGEDNADWEGRDIRDSRAIDFTVEDEQGAEVTREAPKPTLWTLVVDGVDFTTVTIHQSEADALAGLRKNFTSDDEDVADDDLIQHVCDQGNLVYIESHEVTW